MELEPLQAEERPQQQVRQQLPQLLLILQVILEVLNLPELQPLLQEQLAQQIQEKLLLQIQAEPEQQQLHLLRVIVELGLHPLHKVIPEQELLPRLLKVIAEAEQEQPELQLEQQPEAQLPLRVEHSLQERLHLRGLHPLHLQERLLLLQELHLLHLGLKQGRGNSRAEHQVPQAVAEELEQPELLEVWEPLGHLLLQVKVLPQIR